MKFLAECYPCVMSQALRASQLVSGDAGFQHRCLTEAAKILSQVTPEMTPPEVGEPIYRMIRNLSGSEDPFREQKKKQNQAVEALLPWLKKNVESAEDPLLAAVRLSIAGNAVDPGSQESFELERSLMEAVDKEKEYSGYPALCKGIKEAERILFVADNCGEIVFDRLLIETILGISDVEVVLAVRGAPIINDVTGVEAREVGLDKISTIISSGMEMPGTFLPRCKDRFCREFDTADIVISKGQGNWETLEDCGREVFFLLQAKCRSVAAVNRCQMGEHLLIHSRGSMPKSSGRDPLHHQNDT